MQKFKVYIVAHSMYTSSFDKIWQLQDEPPPRFNDTSHCISFEKEEEISDVALDKCSVYFLH